MYVPQHYREDSVPVLHEAIRAIAFGTLVTLDEDGLVASHVPMLLDPHPSPWGTLSGHLARGNPQWRTARNEIEALAIFLGPQAYVSPSWSQSKARTGKAVPTWNYVSIHAYGALRFIDDPVEIRAHVTRLTAEHEEHRAQPWQVSDAPADYIGAMVKGIIAFELALTRRRRQRVKGGGPRRGRRSGRGEEPARRRNRALNRADFDDFRDVVAQHVLDTGLQGRGRARAARA